jgi:hypothetical protein
MRLIASAALINCVALAQTPDLKWSAAPIKHFEAAAFIMGKRRIRILGGESHKEDAGGGLFNHLVRVLVRIASGSRYSEIIPVLCPAADVRWD